MDRLISIPRQALEELLKAAGSQLTPEQYLASLMVASPYRRYPSRAIASLWSKGLLVVPAIISVVWQVFDLSLEGVIVAVILTAITFFEYRVNQYFREENLKAPDLGYYNQSAFAVFILLYCIYHAYMASPTAMMREYNNMLDPDQMAAFQSMIKMSYVIVGIAGGLSQFGLAWYYRSARISNGSTDALKSV